MLYVVKYSGPFGFIKPWTAVRDELTFSQQFLTPSIIEGIRQKLEVEKIIRHKLTYAGISKQQENIQSRGIDKVKIGTVTYFHRHSWKKGKLTAPVISRGVMINPDLYLAFENEKDALKAHNQHLCLCRNEDILLPESDWKKMSVEEFDNLPGFELRFEKNDRSFLVGFNRFNNAEPMYGWLDVTRNPLKTGNVL